MLLHFYCNYIFQIIEVWKLKCVLVKTKKLVERVFYRHLTFCSWSHAWLILNHEELSKSSEAYECFHYSDWFSNSTWRTTRRWGHSDLDLSWWALLSVASRLKVSLVPCKYMKTGLTCRASLAILWWLTIWSNMFLASLWFVKCTSLFELKPQSG